MRELSFVEVENVNGAGTIGNKVGGYVYTKLTSIGDSIGTRIGKTVFPFFGIGASVGGALGEGAGVVIGRVGRDIIQKLIFF